MQHGCNKHKGHMTGTHKKANLPLAISPLFNQIKQNRTDFYIKKVCTIGITRITFLCEV